MEIKKNQARELRQTLLKKLTMENSKKIVRFTCFHVSTSRFFFFSDYRETENII